MNVAITESGRQHSARGFADAGYATQRKHSHHSDPDVLNQNNCIDKLISYDTQGRMTSQANDYRDGTS
jgi:hypothetical protein